MKQREAEKAGLEEELERLKAPQSVTTSSSEEAGVVSEERLRWQMEKENLRKELTAKMDAEKEPILREKEALELKVRHLEETRPSLTKEQVTALEQTLNETHSRFVPFFEVQILMIINLSYKHIVYLVDCV